MPLALPDLPRPRAERLPRRYDSVAYFVGFCIFVASSILGCEGTIPIKPRMASQPLVEKRGEHVGIFFPEAFTEFETVSEFGGVTYRFPVGKGSKGLLSDILSATFEHTTILPKWSNQDAWNPQFDFVLVPSIVNFNMHVNQGIPFVDPTIYIVDVTYDVEVHIEGGDPVQRISVSGRGSKEHDMTFNFSRGIRAAVDHAIDDAAAALLVDLSRLTIEQ